MTVEQFAAWILAFLCALPVEARPRRSCPVPGTPDVVVAETPIPQLVATNGGFVVLSDGQSLMAGSGGNPALTTTTDNDNLRLWDGDDFPSCVEVDAETHVTAMLSHLRNAAGPDRYWLGDTFAVGGTALTAHLQGSVIYDNMLEGVQDSWDNRAELSGGTLRVVALAWGHGESDIAAATALGTYATSLADMQSDLQTDIRAITGQTEALPFFVFVLGTEAFNDPGAGSRYSRLGFADRLVRMGIDYPRRFFPVAPRYFMPHADGQHLDNEGYRLQGDYFGMALNAVLIDGLDWRGLYPDTIVASGSTIRVCYHVPCVLMGTCDAGPRLALDTTAVTCPGATNGDGTCRYGFELYDPNPQPRYITGVAVDGNTSCIDITLDSAVQSGTQLAYAYTGIDGAHGGPGVTNSLGSQRGNVRDTNTTEGRESEEILRNWALPMAPRTVTGGAAPAAAVASLIDDKRWNWTWTSNNCPAAGQAFAGVVDGAAFNMPYASGTWTCASATPGNAAEAALIGATRSDAAMDHAAPGGCWRTPTGTGETRWDVEADEDITFRYVGTLGRGASNYRLINFRGDDASTEWYVQVSTTGQVTVLFTSAASTQTYNRAGLIPASETFGFLDVHITKRGMGAANEFGSIQVCWNSDCAIQYDNTTHGATGTGNLGLNCSYANNLPNPFTSVFHGVAVGEAGRVWWTPEVHDADHVACVAAGFCP